MHRCLSCNQTCSISSIFCDACRVSLLERRTEFKQEEQRELVKVGKREEGMADAPSATPVEAAPTGPQVETALTGHHIAQEPTVSSEQTDEKSAWSLQTSGIYTVEAGDGMGELENRNGSVQATNVLAIPFPARRAMPRRVRQALLIFCIVGSLALLTDGVLLALSVIRHHPPPVAHYTSGVIVPQGMAPSTARQATSTTQPNAAQSFQISSSHLTFSAAQDQTNLAPQTVNLFGGGQSTFSWLVAPEYTLPAWLHLSAMQGNASASTPASFTVSAQPAHLAPGSYTATLQVKAFDNQGKALTGSPETLAVALNVRPPCTLSVNPTKLSFASVLLSTPAAQTVTLTENPNCAFPVYSQVTAYTSWVTFSHSSGTDMGAGGSSSLSVQASSSGQLIGSYTAHITLQATDGSGAPVNVSPTTITVTLTVLA